MGLSVPSLQLVCNSKITLKYKVKKKKWDQESWGLGMALGLWLCPGEARVTGAGSQLPRRIGANSKEMGQCWKERLARAGSDPSPGRCLAVSFAGLFMFCDLQRGLCALSGLEAGPSV